MATIILNRTSEFINRLRNYGVFIDGKKVGTIANGETKEYNVSPGLHTILTKIDWCSSQVVTFDISDGGVKNFEVGAFKNARWLMPAAFIVIVLSYIVKIKYDFEYLFYLAIPALLLLVYYLTIARRRYLKLIETKPDRQENLSWIIAPSDVPP